MFCSILRERDRNPSSCCCRAVPPSQNYWSSAAHQLTSAHDKAAVKRSSAVLLLLSRTGTEGQRGRAAPQDVCARSRQARAPRGPPQRGRQIQDGCPMLRARRVGPLQSCVCIPFGLAMGCVLFALGSYHIAISYFN